MLIEMTARVVVTWKMFLLVLVHSPMVVVQGLAACQLDFYLSWVVREKVRRRGARMCERV